MDIVVFLGALRLFRVADRVRNRPITQVLPRMHQTWSAVRTESIQRSLTATQRAGPRAARWFNSLDTCLTRTMVAATLLEDRSQVRIAIGFRPDQDHGNADGHAWLAVATRAFQLTTPPQLDTHPYTCLAEIPIEARPDITAPRENQPRGNLSDGTGILLDLDKASILRTNTTATVLLNAIDSGVTGIGPLASVLTDNFDVDAATARRDVEAFLTELSSASAKKG